MAKKKMTIEELHDSRAAVDQNILRVRKILETYQSDLGKINSPENRRRLTPQALGEDTAKLRHQTEMRLSTVNATIAQLVRESFEHRASFSYENVLRTARFAPESNARPGTAEAEDRAIRLELLESVRRGNVENRASRYSAQDLVIETERAALEGDTATIQVFAQEARNRKLAGEEKLAFDMAFKKLRIEEIDDAQAVFDEMELLAKEADALALLWREPRNEIAITEESLGRFNRRKRLEKVAAEAEAQAADKAPTKPSDEPEQSSAA